MWRSVTFIHPELIILSQRQEMNRQSDEVAAQHPTLVLGVLLAADPPCLDTPTPSLTTLVPMIGNVCAEAAGMCTP